MSCHNIATATDNQTTRQPTIVTDDSNHVAEPVWFKGLSDAARC